VYTDGKKPQLMVDYGKISKPQQVANILVVQGSKKGTGASTSLAASMRTSAARNLIQAELYSKTSDQN
jgi:hypothetical protein